MRCLVNLPVCATAVDGALQRMLCACRGTGSSDSPGSPTRNPTRKATAHHGDQRTCKKRKHLTLELVLSNMQRFREIPCKTPGQLEFSSSSAHTQLSVKRSPRVLMHRVLIEKNPLPKSIIPNLRKSWPLQPCDTSSTSYETQTPILSRWQRQPAPLIWRSLKASPLPHPPRNLFCCRFPAFFDEKMWEGHRRT